MQCARSRPRLRLQPRAVTLGHSLDSALCLHHHLNSQDRDRIMIFTKKCIAVLHDSIAQKGIAVLPEKCKKDCDGFHNKAQHSLTTPAIEYLRVAQV